MTAYIDGVRVADEDAKVSVYDRGFLYGDGVFEVVRTYDGHPFALREHLARLERSREAMRIPLPAGSGTLEGEVRRAIAAARAEAPGVELYVRVMITRGSGGAFGLAPRGDFTPTRVVLVRRLDEASPELLARGVSAITTPRPRAVDGTRAAHAKATSYLANILALAEAHERGADDAIFVDDAGRVLETTTANLFVRMGTRVRTPPVDVGILAGITREHALALLADEPLAVEVHAPTVDELAAADEVFVTSSVRELVSVVAVDGHPIGDGRPGACAERLRLRLRERARSLAAADAARAAKGAP